MATTDLNHETPGEADYGGCLFKPMTENGEGKPIVEPTHVLDAFIVAGIVFFSVLIGDALINIYIGNSVLVTVQDVAQRLVTAGLAFGLTFLVQWARYRGIKHISGLPIEIKTEDPDDNN